ncbi:hypothetical protein HDU84_003148 [Entophlyctis sp. JEL0112]|nr:hypothetical protein HDU84_003148 [Entophlyctis sp. JEL0112]
MTPRLPQKAPLREHTSDYLSTHSAPSESESGRCPQPAAPPRQGPVPLARKAKSPEHEELKALIERTHPTVKALFNPIVVDNPDVLADVALRTRLLVEQYPQKFEQERREKQAEPVSNKQTRSMEPTKLQLLNKIQKKGADEYDKDDFIRVTRLASQNLPLRLHKHNTCRDKYSGIVTHAKGLVRYGRLSVPCTVHEEVKSQPASDSTCSLVETIVESVIGFSKRTNEYTEKMNRSEDTFVVEWYVSFTDYELYAFHDSRKFASEEVTALENPALGSVKDCLQELASKGILRKKTNYFANLKKPETPLIIDEVHFYLPKDKLQADLRYEELAMMSRDHTNRCTPVLVMGVPKLATISTDGFKSLSDVDDRLQNSELSFLQLHDHDARVENNFICMSAPDRLANPRRPQIGPYTMYQVRTIFRTAYTAFRGAVMKSKEVLACLQIDEIEREHDHTPLPSSLKLTGLDIAIHTGDWGCGEFQNNPTVIAYLQIAAAYATGVNHLFYHVKEHDSHVAQARSLLLDVWKGDEVSLDDVLKHIVDQKFEWGKPKKK